MLALLYSFAEVIFLTFYFFFFNYLVGKNRNSEISPDTNAELPEYDKVNAYGIISQVLFPCLHACLVTQSWLTLCDPSDCSIPGSSIHGIFQARILEQVAVSFSMESSWSRDWTCTSCVSWIAGRFFPYSAIREALLLPYSPVIIYLFFLNFCWHIVALQCCVSSTVQFCRGYILDFLFFLFNQNEFIIFILTECYPEKV